MLVETVKRYTFNGIEYKSLSDVHLAVEEVIGTEVLDTIVREIDIRHKDILKLYEILCRPKIRGVLVNYLNVNFEVEEDDEISFVNILDYKK